MKYFFVLALAVVGAVAAPRADGDDVLSTIENVVKTLFSYVPEPALDIHGKDGKIDLGFEQLDFTTYDIVLKGIKSLDISSMTYDKETGRLEYDWVIPTVEADIEFDLTLTGILDAVNQPVVKIVLNNLKLSGYATIDTAASPTKLTDFKLLVGLESAEVRLKGMLNDDALDEKLEGILNKQLPALVADVAALLEPAVSPLIKTLINFVISILD